MPPRARSPPSPTYPLLPPPRPHPAATLRKRRDPPLQIAILGDWDDPDQFAAFRQTPAFKEIADGLGMIGDPEVTVMQEMPGAPA